MEIVQCHLQDALRHGHTGCLLDGLGVVLKEEPGEQKRCAGSNDAPGYGFCEVPDAGFFRIGHGLIACTVLGAAVPIFLD